MGSADQTLFAEKRDGHLWVTFNRPEKANALTVDMLQRATAAVTEAASDPEVRAIVVTSSGERFFSAGVDVREKPEDGDMARQRERRSQAQAALQDAVMDAPKPVIVALNGSAIGAGAMLAFMADACVAVDSAELSLPEIDLRIATFSGSNICEVIGGRALALDLIQTGRRMPAREALARGLIARVASREELQEAVTASAQLLGSKDAQTFSENKRWINRSLRAAVQEAREQHARHRAKAAQ